jgi:hypothetical protein
LLGGKGRDRISRHDDLHLALHQLGHEARELLGSAGSPAVCQVNVLALNPAEGGSLAPHVQNFTLTASLPSLPRRYNREIINKSSG